MECRGTLTGARGSRGNICFHFLPVSRNRRHRQNVTRRKEESFLKVSGHLASRFPIWTVRRNGRQITAQIEPLTLVANRPNGTPPVTKSNRDKGAYIMLVLNSDRDYIDVRAT